jgi:hypothetical protein
MGAFSKGRHGSGEGVRCGPLILGLCVYEVVYKAATYNYRGSR